MSNTVTDEQVEMREEWRPIDGPVNPYEVSSLGRVRNAATGKILRPRFHGDGHVTAWMPYASGWRGEYVHRLVLIAFRGPAPEGRISLHANGNPADNRLDNLRWGTLLDNARDAIAHGRQVRGESNGRAKLTTAEVRQIRLAYVPRSRQANIRVLARQFGVNAETIRKIVCGKHWTHVAAGPTPPATGGER